MEEELKTFPGGRGNTATFKGKFNLDTLEDSRETYSRVIKSYAKGKISENQGRALSYMLTGYLSYWKLIKDNQIEERLEEIEKLLEVKK